MDGLDMTLEHALRLDNPASDNIYDEFYTARKDVFAGLRNASISENMFSNLTSLLVNDFRHELSA